MVDHASLFFNNEAMDIYPWLSGFINLERGIGGKAGEHFKLSRMEILSGIAGRPEKCAPVIHVAGSKGKGSVTAMISAVLEAAGKKCARYLSPHVCDWRERICLGSGFFPEAVYASAGEELREVYRAYDPASAGEPTFFELLTLYFFLCARKEGCDVMAVETGLGGRLDATNIVDPLLSVITPIELEHTEYLGNTLEEIAGEKAGIIKPGRPVVLSEQKPSVLEVFKKAAGKKSAPLWYLPSLLEVDDIRIFREKTDFTLRDKGPSGKAPLPCSVSMTGAVQGYNAALAVLALRLAFPQTGDNAVLRGLAEARLPARFQRVPCSVPFIVDGAHTPRSVSLCVDSFCALYGEGGILLFGCAAEKNVKAIAELLAPHFSKVIVTAPGSFRASDPEKAFRAFQETPAAPGPVRLIPETKKAIETALTEAAAGQSAAGPGAGNPILATGSFYLAAEILAFFKSRGVL
jgi:dihydrofolate synthase/folylpolyglutamate synthase